MRIISKTNDYYDGVGRSDKESLPVYVRNHKEYQLNEFPTHPAITYVYNDFGINVILIGFCGKVYPAFQIKRYLKPDINLFTKDEVIAYIESQLKKSELEYFRTKKIMFAYSRSFETKFEVEQFFSEVKHCQTDFMPIFEKYKTAQFVMECTYRGWVVLHVGIPLKNFGFQKIFNPYQAYQEINMFMGNFAEDRKSMPIISDELKAQSHGFDKLSFRKPKSTDRNY